MSDWIFCRGCGFPDLDLNEEGLCQDCTYEAERDLEDQREQAERKERDVRATREIYQAPEVSGLSA